MPDIANDNGAPAWHDVLGSLVAADGADNGQSSDSPDEAPEEPAEEA